MFTQSNSQRDPTDLLRHRWIKNTFAFLVILFSCIHINNGKYTNIWFHDSMFIFIELAIVLIDILSFSFPLFSILFKCTFYILLLIINCHNK